MQLSVCLYCLSISGSWLHGCAQTSFSTTISQISTDLDENWQICCCTEYTPDFDLTSIMHGWLQTKHWQLCFLFVMPKIHHNSSYIQRISSCQWPTHCQPIDVWQVAPHAGSGVVRIDPLCFLARCHTRQLNQAISVLYLSMFYCVLLLFITALF